MPRLSSPTAIGERLLSRNAVPARHVLGVAVLGSALAFVDATIVNVAFPDIRADFAGSSLGSLSWVLNAYNITFAALLVPAGRLADLAGRRRMFLAGVWLFTVASVLCAVAPSLGLLIAMRVLQAAGAAVIVPTSLALVLQAYDEPHRTEGVSLWSASAALAAGLGPSLGGLLVNLDGWRLAFLVNVPIGVLALLLARRVLVESRAPGRRRLPDLRGALALAGGTAALTFGIVQAPDRGWADWLVLTAFAAAAGLITVLVTRTGTHPRPILDPELLRDHDVAVATVLTVVAAAGFYAYVLNNVLYLTTIWGYSVLSAGLALTPGPLVAAAVARPAGRLSVRIGPRWVLLVGGAVWAVGVLLLEVRVGPTPAFVGEWLPAMIVLGLGAGLTFPVLGSAAVATVSGGRYAMATSLNAIARQLGAVLGVALLVAIVGRPRSAQDALHAFDRGWLFAIGCFGGTALISLALRGSRPSPAADAGTEVVADTPQEPAPVAPAVPCPVASAAAADLSVTSNGNGAVATAVRQESVLASVPLLAGLRPELLAELEGRATPMRLAEGDVLMREGDPGDALYIVESGRLEVFWARDGRDIVLDVLGPGAVVGEFAVLTGEPRSASVRARRDCSLVRLAAEDMRRAQDEDPAFSHALVRNLGKQLSRARIELPVPPPPSEVLAVVPLHRDLPLDGLRDAIVAGFSRSRPACALERPEDPDAAAELLDRAERDHPHVLLVTAGRDDAWTRFCLRHADRTIVVADVSAPPPDVGQLELAALRGCDLVAVGDGPVSPWSDMLDARARYVVRPGDEHATLAAAARRITGTSVGLVLSGGGARGLAHIGVIEELIGAGIVIDRVGGCSFGSLVGGAFARGLTPDEIDAFVYEECVRRRPLSDYRIPRISIIRGRGIEAVVDRLLPGDFEDLPRDMFMVSADLVSGELVVHRRGALRLAARASISIPGLVPPVIEGDRLLVDGGVRNNLPVDVMAATGEGPVIAVDVTNRMRIEPDGQVGFEEDRLPRLGETLLRSLTMASFDAAESAARQAALVIRPDNDGVGLFEFHQLDALREAGRRAAVAALDRMPEGALS